MIIPMIISMLGKMEYEYGQMEEWHWQEDPEVGEEKNIPAPIFYQKTHMCFLTSGCY